LTMAAILERANAGSGTLYNYFSSKEDLIDTLYAGIRKKSSDNISAGIRSEGDVKEWFEEFVGIFLDYSISNLEEMIFVEEYSYYLYTKGTETDIGETDYYKDILALYAKGMEQGHIKKMQMSMAMQIVNGIVMVIARGVRSGKTQLSSEDRQIVIDACWNAIKA